MSMTGRPEMSTVSIYRLSIVVALCAILMATDRCRAAGPEVEFRGMVVTTAYNTDWPSQPGLYEGALDNEIEAILNRAEELNFNAIILQVRAFGDRIRDNSHIARRFPDSEPWSRAVATD